MFVAVSDVRSWPGVALCEEHRGASGQLSGTACHSDRPGAILLRDARQKGSTRKRLGDHRNRRAGRILIATRVPERDHPEAAEWVPTARAALYLA
jgi:hypothetical protein